MTDESCAGNTYKQTYAGTLSSAILHRFDKTNDQGGYEGDEDPVDAGLLTGFCRTRRSATMIRNSPASG